MIAKLLGFVVYVEVIVYLLLHNSAFIFKRQTLYKCTALELETVGFLHLLVLVCYVLISHSLNNCPVGKFKH